MKQNRFASKVFWIGILSAIALALKSFGVVTVDDQLISGVVDAVFTALTIFGIANDPTSKSSF